MRGVAAALIGAAALASAQAAADAPVCADPTLSTERRLCADVDGDGAPEYVVAEGRELRVHPGDTDVLFERARWTAPGAAALRLIGAADFDADGAAEVAVLALDAEGAELILLAVDGARVAPVMSLTGVPARERFDPADPRPYGAVRVCADVAPEVVIVDYGRAAARRFLWTDWGLLEIGAVPYGADRAAPSAPDALAAALRCDEPG